MTGNVAKWIKRSGYHVKIEVVHGDVSEREADLLILKIAGEFHGADAAVAQRLKFAQTVQDGEFRLVKGGRVGADNVAFLGVGPLQTFRYGEIRTFGQRALRIARGLGFSIKKSTDLATVWMRRSLFWRSLRASSTRSGRASLQLTSI